MNDADALNAALEDAEQAILRREFKRRLRENGTMLHVSETDTFDQIPGTTLIFRRSPHTALMQIPAGEYGS